MNLRGPKVRISRQLGISLTPKAQKHLDRRPGTPGQHGLNQRPGKMSNYKRQLMEKQRLRAQYNVGERQLRNYFEEASRRGGNVGAALLQLLETRIDAMVLRAGYARTIFAARQLVVHGHVKLNGRRVSFPSHAVIPGDQIYTELAPFRRWCWRGTPRARHHTSSSAAMAPGCVNSPRQRRSR